MLASAKIVKQIVGISFPLDLLDEGLLDFWRALNKNNVTYIMVGGFAVNMKGYIRSTKDLILWLKDSPGNRKNFRTAFAELGYGDFASLKQWSLLLFGLSFT